MGARSGRSARLPRAGVYHQRGGLRIKRRDVRRQRRLHRLPDHPEVIAPLITRVQLAVAARVRAARAFVRRIVAAAVDDARREIDECVVVDVGTVIDPLLERVGVARAACVVGLHVRDPVEEASDPA